MSKRHLETSQILQPTTTTAWTNQNSRQQINHQQTNQVLPGDVVTIMRKQNEITAALVYQQRLLSLPA